MVEKRSQRHDTWVVLLLTVAVFLVAGVGWRESSPSRSALAAEPAPKTKVSPQARRLPDDLVQIAEAKYASLDGLAAGSREAQDRQRQAVQQLGLPLEVRTRKTGIVFRLVPTGNFTMGSPSSESQRGIDEDGHRVTLTKPFYCGKFEVTQGQWEQVVGGNPSFFKRAGQDAPVERVSWDDCQAFVQILCRKEGVREGTYRLLTEAEWEYACRAGTATTYIWGDSFELGKCNAENDSDSSTNENVATFRSRGIPTDGTIPVGQFAPNGWGLYDMHGNVWEWCQDWHGRWASGEVSDPVGPASGIERVNRGGSWFDGHGSCRSAFRNRDLPVCRIEYLGFRLARTIPSCP
jgi:sulfatase modifying factor 1